MDRLPYLKELQLRDNKLEGGLQASTERLSSLHVIDLSVNRSTACQRGRLGLASFVSSARLGLPRRHGRASHPPGFSYDAAWAGADSALPAACAAGVACLGLPPHSCLAFGPRWVVRSDLTSISRDVPSPDPS